jgi:hypothetical protein
MRKVSLESGAVNKDSASTPLTATSDPWRGRVDFGTPLLAKALTLDENTGYP